jgi:ribonuclease Z
LQELVVLGSSGAIPREGMITTSLAVRLDDLLLILDAGSGLARLFGAPYCRLVPPQEQAIHIFLSHLHLDHVVGLTFLPALWKNPTVIHIPSVDGEDPDADVEPRRGCDRLENLFGGPFFPLAFPELVPGISSETVGPGETEIAGHILRARWQRHPGGSLGYRLGDLLAFVTDSTPDPGTVEFVRGVRVLVHEASWAETSDSELARAALTGHSTAEQAARVALDAEVGELLLSHLPPSEDGYLETMLMGARAVFPGTELCFDGLTRKLG